MSLQLKIHPKRILNGLVLLLPSLLLLGQTNTSRWEDYFSYAHIRHIHEVNGIIYCSAENGLFSYDPNGGEIDKISKVNELNDVDITAFNYNPYLGILMVGYRSGELDMLGGEENYNLLEIPLHQAYSGSKQVNHISSHESTAIISGEFGLASFSLENFEFMETTYFTQMGVYFGVKESAILDGIIYAASTKGIFTHTLDEFIANFVTWEQPAGVPTTAFQNIINFQGNIVASTGDAIYRFDGNNWMFMGNFPNLRDLNVNEDVLSITQNNTVSNYNSDFNLLETTSFIQELNTGIKVGNTTYGGSILFGLINGNNEILPDGPYNNKSWSVTAHKDRIWIAPGGMNSYNSPLQNADGFYYFDGTSWIQITSEEMLGAKDILDIEVNPNDPTEFYVSPWFEHVSWDLPDSHIGILQFKDTQMIANFNSENSGLKFRERIGGSVFDDVGNLWIGQSYTSPGERTYMVRKKAAGGWDAIDLDATIANAGAKKPIFYNGYAFMALPRGGGVRATNMQSVLSVSASPSKGNLPSNAIYAIAIDKNGVLWIGSELGLRVLYNPIQTMQLDEFEAQPIIIEQSGIPEALLNDTQINAIQVDGTNQKWVATQSSGVYYFSEDGTETVLHFTSGNSPLPSNSVNSIFVENSTGVVYFATEKGVVSYRSDAVEGGDSFGDVYSYPNPVRPGFTGDVTIKGLPIDADVRIVDITGNLIYKTKARGGVAKWNTKNMKGKPVASGIYLVLMTNQDASESKQTKIAIVR